MPYERLPISSSSPGLIVILVDQSGSMQENYEFGKTKAQFAALAVNRCIYNIINACMAGEKIKDRCHIAVIGYGPENAPKLVVAGRASEVHNEKKREDTIKRKISDGAGGLVEVDEALPVWLDPVSDNGTPFAEALIMAGELIKPWIQEHSSNFPPIVINITDGAPNDMPSARAAAQSLACLNTDDGAVLLFNAHIGARTQGELVMPAQGALPSQHAQFLFDITSVIPPTMLAAAEMAFERKLSSGAKAFVMNASAETLTKLLVFGSTPMTSTQLQ